MAVDSKTLRLLDANLNRAREGLRVVEDTARFMWSDGGLYKALRRLRHDLHRLTASRYKLLVKSRDSKTDAGRYLPESSRISVEAVVASNMRRAQEAIRVLEEYSKVFHPSASKGFKSIRFRLYIEEKKVLKRL